MNDIDRDKQILKIVEDMNHNTELMLKRFEELEKKSRSAFELIRLMQLKIEKFEKSYGKESYDVEVREHYGK